jgi:hypothetical protein
MNLDGKKSADHGAPRFLKRGPVSAGLGLLIAAGLVGAATVSAAPVTVVGETPCSKGCVDTYEVKCPKASRLLQFTLEAVPAPGDPGVARFQMTAIGTAPATMINQDFVRVAENLPGLNPKTTAMLRPGPEGTMKAIVAVSPVLNGAPTPSYRLTAECFSGETLGDFVSKKTTIDPRTNQ